jgi:hypothetical protein
MSSGPIEDVLAGYQRWLLESTGPCGLSEADQSARDRANDRKVRRLSARGRHGKPATWWEIFKVCPYRTLLFSPECRPDLSAPPHCLVGCLCFAAEDFSDRMRADILSELRAGRTVLLLANNAAVRDYAKREIMLALTEPRGAA